MGGSGFMVVEDLASAPEPLVSTFNPFQSFFLEIELGLR